jgi:mono/diheme cytochrome c family protein
MHPDSVAICLGPCLSFKELVLMKILLHGFSTISLILSVAQAAAGDDTALARDAQSILRANCYRCHGQEGSNEGGFSYILDRQRLLAAHKIVPGHPAKSALFKRVKRGEMPPEDEKPRPSEADVATLRQWIEAGAPDFNPPKPPRKLISPAEVVQRILSDLQTVGERDRPFIRYFTLTHLYNAGWSEDELEGYRAALSKLVNSLSWGRRIVRPVPADESKTILRIDLRDYKWSETIWNNILAGYPYGVVLSTRAAHLAAAATASPLPYVRGDWFVAAASIPPLYHEVLQLPGNDRELEKLLRLDADEDIRQERVARAGFNGSGVSRSNRLIERHESSYGAYWRSYDFAGSADRKNLFAHPLGPAGTNAFEHDGGEIIFTLPNGLQGYMLVDATGNRIERGPTTIVSDPKQADRAVVNGLSCMSCHVNGIIDKSDQVRESVLKNPNAFEKKEAATILALYPAKKEFDKLLEDDRQRFTRGVAASGGRVDRDGRVIGSDPVVNLALLFEREVDGNLLAAEAGVTAETLLKALDRSPELGRVLGPLKVDGGTIQRQQVVKIFPDLVRELKVGSFISTAKVGVANKAASPATDSPSHRLAPKEIKDPLLAQALIDLKSSDMWARKKAAEQLARAEANDDRDTVAQALEPVLNDSNAATRRAAVKALGVWGTKESVPALIKVLKGDDVFARRDTLLALGKLKDQRAITPLVECLATAQTRADAANALKEMGSMSEKEVAKLLTHGDVWTRAEACKVLRDIGTQSSVPALTRVVRENNIHTRTHVAPAALEALREIKERQKERKR